MGYGARAYIDRNDLFTMVALAQRFREENLHCVDLPYRFSSWAFDDPENIRLWFNPQGVLLAWLVMQPPFWTVDFALDPAVEPDLLPKLIAWADERARIIKDGPSGRPAWFITPFARQKSRIHILETMGFVCQSGVGEDSWSKVWLARSADAPIEFNPLPDGLTIRPFGGEGEVAAYVELHHAVFQTKNMTLEWRTRTLRQPAYLPELDLVAVAPNGQLAGFCIAWLDLASNGPFGQIEPLGVRDAFRGLGIGRALLTEALRRLFALGAKTVFVETDNNRDSALALYHALGFRLHDDVLMFRKDYP